MHAAPTPAQARPAGTGPARGLRRLRTIAAAAVLAAGAAVPAVVSAGPRTRRPRSRR
ncbi:hypothetical protein ACFQHO_00630 [Actinomadura yumaensis]|uniref:hypothetical protein n=1 Tax=Actinomadura yumaensis TaxID=111807 RepID=UPI00360E9B38